MLDPMLARLGLANVSWTRRSFDVVDRNAARVLGRLLRGLTAGDILLLHDGVAAHEKSGEATALAVLPSLLERLADQGLRPVSLRAACSDERDA